jgi:hypothetical protein
VRTLILANSEEVQRLRERINETFRLRGRSKEHRERWQTACREFNTRYDQLAFPGGYSTAKQKIAAGDLDAIEAALCFVEIRPYFFRSGYMFKELLPKLKRANLSSEQRERLARVLLAYQDWRETKRRSLRT